MDFLYSSYETTLKDETTKVFVPVSSALSLSSDEKKTGTVPSIIPKTHQLK